MPCWTTTETEVDIGKGTNPEILHAALVKLGLVPIKIPGGIRFNQGNFDARTGVLTLLGQDVESRTADIKRAYSGQIVVSSARKAGWQVREVSKDKYQVMKRF